MGQYFSSQKEVQEPLVLPREEVKVIITDTYQECKKPQKKQKMKLLGEPYQVAIKPPLKGMNLIMLRIRQNPIIKMNSNLLVAKASVFDNNDISRHFANSLSSMIMETNRVQQMIRDFRGFPEASCRFLKVLVTNDNRYYFMPPVAPNPAERGNWAENLFEGILNEDKSLIFSYLLSIIKRHKQLININEDFIFCLDIILYKRGTTHDIFHRDDDQFGDYQGGRPVYVSTTNISQESEFNLSTQIRVEMDDNLYTLASRLGEFTLFNNNMLQHRTPPEINTRGPIITKAKYDVADVIGTGRIPSYNRSILSKLDQVILEKDPNIVKINDSLSSGDRRNLIRILVKNGNDINVTDLREITDLVPLDIFISPSVNYFVSVSNRNIDNQDIKTIFSTELIKHSIGGKSKKKRRKRKNITKKRIRKNYSSRQRGGAGELTNLKYLNEYFAIYTDPETACLIENNIEVIL
jgi:hypothetical protein